MESIITREEIIESGDKLADLKLRFLRQNGWEFDNFVDMNFLVKRTAVGKVGAVLAEDALKIQYGFDADPELEYRLGKVR